MKRGLGVLIVLLCMSLAAALDPAGNSLDGVSAALDYHVDWTYQPDTHVVYIQVDVANIDGVAVDVVKDQYGISGTTSYEDYHFSGTYQDKIDSDTRYMLRFSQPTGVLVDTYYFTVTVPADTTPIGQPESSAQDSRDGTTTSGSTISNTGLDITSDNASDATTPFIVKEGTVVEYNKDGTVVSDNETNHTQAYIQKLYDSVKDASGSTALEDTKETQQEDTTTYDPLDDVPETPTVTDVKGEVIEKKPVIIDDEINENTQRLLDKKVIVQQRQEQLVEDTTAQQTVRKALQDVRPDIAENFDERKAKASQKTVVRKRVIVSKDNDSISSTVVISVVAVDEAVDVVEVIPKDVATHVSELSFGVEPVILQEDPVVMWHVEPGSDVTELSYQVNKNVSVVGNTILLADKADSKNTVNFAGALPVLIIPLLAGMIIYFARRKPV